MKFLTILVILSSAVASIQGVDFQFDVNLNSKLHDLAMEKVRFVNTDINKFQAIKSGDAHQLDPLVEKLDGAKKLFDKIVGDIDNGAHVQDIYHDLEDLMIRYETGEEWIEERLSFVDGDLKSNMKEAMESAKTTAQVVSKVGLTVYEAARVMTNNPFTIGRQEKEVREKTKEALTSLNVSEKVSDVVAKMQNVVKSVN